MAWRVTPSSRAMSACETPSWMRPSISRRRSALSRLAAIVCSMACARTSLMRLNVSEWVAFGLVTVAGIAGGVTWAAIAAGGYVFFGAFFWRVANRTARQRGWANSLTVDQNDLTGA